MTAYACDNPEPSPVLSGTRIAIAVPYSDVPAKRNSPQPPRRNWKDDSFDKRDYNHERAKIQSRQYKTNVILTGYTALSSSPQVAQSFLSLDDSGCVTDSCLSESRLQYSSSSMGLEHEQVVSHATSVSHNAENDSVYQLNSVGSPVSSNGPVVASALGSSPLLPKPKEFLKALWRNLFNFWKSFFDLLWGRSRLPKLLDYNSINSDRAIIRPDQVIPTDAIKDWRPDGAVKLSIGDRGLDSIPPISVPTLLERTTERFTDRLALAVKRDGKWQEYTYRAYLQNVRTVAKAFIRLGLEPFHGVCILGFNSPEWFFSNIGAIYAGGLAAGIYTTNTAESVLHCARNCKANIFVVEDKKQLEKVLKIKDQLPNLKAIIQYSDKPDVEGVISWSQLLNLGNSCTDTQLDERLKRIAVNQCCTVIYTSGTTGAPKGVMLSHDNLTWNAHAVVSWVRVKDRETMISFLPLSHVAAQIVDIYGALSMGASIYFADPDALKGSLINTLIEVKPTIFFGVPRVWEKIYEKMMDVGSQTKGLKRAIATWAKGLGTKYNSSAMQGDDSKPFGFFLAERIVFRKVREALGLENTRLCYSGAAPISIDILNYFASLNIPIYEYDVQDIYSRPRNAKFYYDVENLNLITNVAFHSPVISSWKVYGMSESTGPHTLDVPHAFKFGSTGKTVPGSRTVIYQPDKDGNGEICMGGRDVFMGYLDDEQKTHEAIDDDGLLHSGDIGKVDQFGFLLITGRIKELLITAGGENVAPVLIEDNAKAELPCVSQAMVIGDRRKFLSILLTLKTNVLAETQEPLNTLTNGARNWFLENAGIDVSTVEEVIQACSDPKGKTFLAIQNGMIRANGKAVSNAQKVQKWQLLPKDFSIHGGELGPTLKLKRPVVCERYAEVIESLYK